MNRNQMNRSVFRFTLNMHSLRSQATVTAFKGDTAISLYITLTDGGNPYEIAEGCRAVLGGTKADGNKLFNPCVIDHNKNIIIYDFTEQTTAQGGIVNCEITLYGPDNQVITAPKFAIAVDEKEYTLGSTPNSTNELAVLDQLVIDHNERKEAHTDIRETLKNLQETVANQIMDVDAILADAKKYADSKDSEVIDNTVPRMHVLDAKNTADYYNMGDKYNRVYVEQSKGRGVTTLYCLSQSVAPPPVPGERPYKVGQGRYFQQGLDGNIDITSQDTVGSRVSTSGVNWVESAEIASTTSISLCLTEDGIQFNKLSAVAGGSIYFKSLKNAQESPYKLVFETDLKFTNYAESNAFVGSAFRIQGNWSSQNAFLLNSQETDGVKLFTDNSSEPYAENAITFETGKWYRLTIAYQDSTSIIYVNGVEKKEIKDTQLESFEGIKFGTFKAANHVSVTFKNIYCDYIKEPQLYSGDTLDSIVQRYRTGHINVPILPMSDYSATSREYVDTQIRDAADKLAAALYEHNVSMMAPTYDGNTFYMHRTIYNHSPEPISTMDAFFSNDKSGAKIPTMGAVLDVSSPYFGVYGYYLDVEKHAQGYYTSGWMLGAYQADGGWCYEMHSIEDCHTDEIVITDSVTTVQ